MTTPASPPPQGTLREEERDLGFGSVVARESRQRLLNPDGTFNVARTGLGYWTSLSLYHTLLTMSWPRFFALVGAAYLATNALFAGLFVLCGPAALDGPALGTPDIGGGWGTFLRAFFFSVQTLATIGYGHVHPVGLGANLLVVAESLAGLLGFSLATGMVFARFSRPMARIVFSRNAVIAPYRGISAFMIRVANARASELVELQAKIVMSRFERDGERQVRRFYPLALERERVAFFPLTWTLVHPIDAASPLAGWDDAQVRAAGVEFLVLLTGLDATAAHTVHTRTSYLGEQIVWHARFADIFERAACDEGETKLVVNIGRLDEVKPS